MYIYFFKFKFSMYILKEKRFFFKFLFIYRLRNNFMDSIPFYIIKSPVDLRKKRGSSYFHTKQMN